jgi:hypothetical protein
MWTRFQYHDVRGKVCEIASTVLMSIIERGNRVRTNRQNKGQIHWSTDADSTDIQSFKAGTYRLVDFWVLTTCRIANYCKIYFAKCCFPLQSESRRYVDMRQQAPPKHRCQLWIIYDIKRQKIPIFSKFAKTELIINFRYRWSDLNIYILKY